MPDCVFNQNRQASQVVRFDPGRIAILVDESLLDAVLLRATVLRQRYAVVT